jgi:prolyl oligopeptidase
MRSSAAVLVICAFATIAATGALTYPKPPTSNATDTYFGTAVPDPYRPLESIDAPDTAAWVKQENALTRQYLDAIPVRAQIATAYKKLYNYPKTYPPFREGHRYFYYHNTGLQTQNVIFVRDSENGPARVFFDPNTLSKDGSVQVTQTSFTLDGSLMAYSTSTGGADWQTWRVKNVATGKDLPDVINWSKFSGASWDGNRGFYYAAYDAPTSGNKTLSYLGLQKLYFHTLGTPQSADHLVYAPVGHPDRFVSTTVTEDNAYVILQVGTINSTMLEWRPTGSHTEFIPITTLKDNVNYTVLGNDGPKLYLLTNNGAPKFKIVWLNLNDPQHVQHELVPEKEHALSNASLIGNKLYLGYSHNAYTQIAVVTTAGTAVGSIALPGIGFAYVPQAKRHDRIAYYYYTSYATPLTSYRYDTLTMKSTVYSKPEIAFDPSLYVTEQVFATSKDGTKVPVFVTHRKDITLDGNNPTLMYGYGGFDIAEIPYFSTSRALWLQMGGVYADVILRGGGEFGEAWHNAGRLGKKQNVFDDFASAGQMLIDKKFTSTPKLAIDGGSNGGLLVGATITQHPSLFGAAIIEQGVLDMLRYPKFTVGKAWIPEYGDATASADAFHWLDAYSPLHNVKAGTAYPPTLITTADHDDRVFPAHSYKFAAALQAAQSGDAPILLRVQTNEGHFSGLTTDEEIAIYADFYAFLAQNLHFTPTNI